jgi:hypothetical protein
MKTTDLSIPFSRLPGSQHRYDNIPDVSINTLKKYTVVDFPGFVSDMTKNLSSRTAGIKNFCRNSLNLLSDYNNYCLNKVERNILEFKSLFDGLRIKPFMEEPLTGNWKIEELLNEYPLNKNDGAISKTTKVKTNDDILKLFFEKSQKKPSNSSRGTYRSLFAALRMGRPASPPSSGRAGATTPAVDTVPAADVNATTPAMGHGSTEVHYASSQQAEVNDDDHDDGDSYESSIDSNISSTSSSKSESPDAKKNAVNFLSSRSVQNNNQSSSDLLNVDDLFGSGGNSLPNPRVSITGEKGDSPGPTDVPLSPKNSTGDSKENISSKKSAENNRSSDDNQIIPSDESTSGGESIPRFITTGSSSIDSFYTAGEPQANIASSANTNKSQITSSSIEAINEEKKSIHKNLRLLAGEVDLKESQDAGAGNDLSWLKEELKARINEVNALVDLDDSASKGDRAVRGLRLSMLRASADLASEYFRRIQSGDYQPSEHMLNVINADREKSLSTDNLMDQHFGLPQLGHTKTDDINQKIREMDVEAKARSNSILNIKTVRNNEAVARLEIIKEIDQVAREFGLQNTRLETMEKIIDQNKLINSSKRFIKDVKDGYGDVTLDLKINGVDLNDIVEELNKLSTIKKSVQSGLERIKNTNTEVDSLEGIVKMKNILIKNNINNAKKIEQVQASLEQLRSIST